MNLVSRNTLFQDLFDFRRDFDQIFNRMISGWPSDEAQPSETSWTPPVECYVDKNSKLYHCLVSLPGVDPKDVQIQARGSVLAITGERKMSHAGSNVDVLQSEIYYGTFTRTLSLPEAIEADKVTAEYHNGVLDITAPIAASALPRRIEIRTAPAAKQMTAA